MPGDRASVFEATQLGPESSPGVQVAALKRLLSTQFDPIPQEPIEPHRGMGSKYPTSTVQQKRHTQGNITGVLSYNDIVYLFSSLLCTPVITTPGGATNTRRWTFRPVAYGPDTFLTYTCEHGSSLFAERYLYTLINSLTWRMTRGEFSLGGQILAQTLQEAQVLTASIGTLTNPSVAPALSATGSATVAGTVGNPGSAPTGTASSSGGSLATNTYNVSFSYFTANGETLPSTAGSFSVTGPSGSIAMNAVTPLPTGATGVYWYIAIGCGTAYRLTGAPTDGSAFTIQTAPVTGSNPAVSNTATYTLQTGTTNLAAGVYTAKYTYSNQSGETAASPAGTVTIAAGQSVTAASLTGVPANTTVKWYFSPAAGNATVQYSQSDSGATSTVFTAYGLGAVPSGSNTTGPLNVTSIPDLPVNPKDISIWAGNSIGGLARLGRALEWEFNFTDKHAGIFTLDDSTDTYSGDVERAPNWFSRLVVEHNLASQGFMTDLRNQTEKYIRFLATGPLIEAGFPYRIQLTFPAKFREPNRGDVSDVFGATYECRGMQDDAFGTAIEVVVDTALQAL